MGDFFAFLLMASLVPLALGIISVFVGTLQDDEEMRSQCLTFAAKSILVFAVMLMVGFGGCVTSVLMAYF